MEVGLGPGDILLDGDPTPPLFGPCLLRPNGRPSEQLLSSCSQLLVKTTPRINYANDREILSGASRKDLHCGTGMLRVASVIAGVSVCEVPVMVSWQLIAPLSNMHADVLSAIQKHATATKELLIFE